MAKRKICFRRPLANWHRKINNNNPSPPKRDGQVMVPLQNCEGVNESLTLPGSTGNTAHNATRNQRPTRNWAGTEPIEQLACAHNMPQLTVPGRRWIGSLGASTYPLDSPTHPHQYSFFLGGKDEIYEKAPQSEVNFRCTNRFSCGSNSPKVGPMRGSGTTAKPGSAMARCARNWGLCYYWHFFCLYRPYYFTPPL